MDILLFIKTLKKKRGEHYSKNIIIYLCNIIILHNVIVKIILVCINHTKVQKLKFEVGDPLK